MPAGWKKDIADVLVPGFLADIDHRLGVEKVAQERPTEAEMDTAVERFQEVVHGLYNNTARATGIPVEGRCSECTWEEAEALGNDLRKFIRDSWKEQDESRAASRRLDEERRAKLARLAEYESAARSIRQELGLPETGGA